MAATVGASILSGNRYGDLQQDSVMIAREAWGIAAVVLDGHGMLGECAAAEAGEALLHHAKQIGGTPLDDHKSRQVLAREAFALGHEAALRLYSEPPEQYLYPKGSRTEAKYRLTYINGLPMYKSLSSGTDRLLELGTTATLAVLQGRHLLVANVGDSAAVLGSRTAAGGYEGLEVSERHWGLNPDEARRVTASVGRRVELLRSDGYLAVAAGRFQGYQLSMTRALGHSMLSDFGVIAKPSIAQRTLDDNDTCLIVASDGVWDCFSPTEAIELCMDVIENGGTAEDAAAALCEESVDRAVSGPDHEADNTSAVVFIFSHVGTDLT